MLTDFMADFPDHEACLVWLWSTRYAIDGEDMAFCEWREQVRTFKSRASGRRRSVGSGESITRSPANTCRYT